MHTPNSLISSFTKLFKVALSIIISLTKATRNSSLSAPAVHSPTGRACSLVQISLPKETSVQWHSHADLVIILQMHVSLVSVTAECPCFLLLTHTRTHTQKAAHMHTNIHSVSGWHLRVSGLASKTVYWGK